MPKLTPPRRTVAGLAAVVALVVGFGAAIATSPATLALLVGNIVLVLVISAVPFALAGGRRPRIAFAVEDGHLVVRLGRRDALFACKRAISIPLTDISQVTTAPKKSVRRGGVRLPGTEIPGVIRAGSFGRKPSREFWDVRRAETVLVIDTTSRDPYARLVFEVDDAAGTAAWLRSASGSDVS